MTLILGIFIGAIALFGVFVIWAVIDNFGQTNAVVVAPAPPPPPWNCELSVQATGQEVFTPEALEKGRAYAITITGDYSYRSGFLQDRAADAIFHTDEHKNFTKRYDGIEIDGIAAGSGNLDSWTEDRPNHSYTCLVEGSGAKMPIRVVAPRDYRSGHLCVKIQILPAGTPSVAARQAAKAQAKAAAAHAQQLTEALQKQRADQARVIAEQQEQQRRQQEQADIARNRLLLRVDRLRRSVQRERNFFDPQYRAELMRLRSEYILSTHRESWFEEYEEIIRENDLVTELQASAPEVLEFHQYRIAMIHEAERNSVVPAPLPAPAPAGPLTARGVFYIQQILKDLLEFTATCDQARKYLATNPGSTHHRSLLEQASRSMAFCLQELARFDIVASTPEEAEVMVLDLCPPPRQALTVYESVVARIRGGKKIPPDAIGERLEDLHREKIILQAKRRACVRDDRPEERRSIDYRLEGIRQEATELAAFLQEIDHKIDLSNPHDRQRENTLEEQFIELYEGKQRLINFLTDEGDTNAIENVEALYAQEQARLFDANSSYT
jgi:hypothetical protein